MENEIANKLDPCLNKRSAKYSNYNGHIDSTVFFKRLKSFTHNSAMNWSRDQQPMGMLSRGGDQGHVSYKKKSYK